KYILNVWMGYTSSNKLLDLVLSSINVCSDYLDISFEYNLSSEFKTFKLKNERLIDLCKSINANKLVLGMGSSNYIEDGLDKYKENNIDISYQDWECPIENYSILDCIARYGLDRTKEILEV